MGCVYKLTSPSGKSYVGITRGTAAERFRAHAKESASGVSALSAAIRRYGAQSFKVEVLEVNDRWQALCDAEVRLIAALGTRAPGGYNLTRGGDGCPGLTPEREAARIAASAAGRTGLKLSTAHRKALSDAHKGLPSNRRGKKASPEYRAKMSEAALRRWQDPEQRAKMLEHLRKLNNA